jgi:hypothetical protein
MPGSINVGFSCRDIDSLGGNEAEVRSFIMDHMMPALEYEIMTRRGIYLEGIGGVVTRSFSPELEARGCEVSGSISIRF